MKQMRGMLTESIKQRAERYLGRELTQEELRLYPYLCYKDILVDTYIVTAEDMLTGDESEEVQ